jgi:hypothetical protein
MTLDQLIKGAPVIGCSFERVRTGDPNWSRLFMKDSRGCTIGRLSFYYRELDAYKLYAKTGPLCESDELYARLEYYLICGQRLRDYGEVVQMAMDNRVDDLNRKTGSRLLLGPNKKRKGLQGKDLRREVRRLVRQLATEEADNGRDTGTIGTQNHQEHGSSIDQGEVPDN